MEPIPKGSPGLFRIAAADERLRQQQPVPRRFGQLADDIARIVNQLAIAPRPHLQADARPESFDIVRFDRKDLLKKGLRGRFGVYMPPLMEALAEAAQIVQPSERRRRELALLLGAMAVGMLTGDAGKAQRADLLLSASARGTNARPAETACVA